MAEGDKQNEIEETQQNKATNGLTKGRKWADQETNLCMVRGFAPVPKNINACWLCDLEA